MRLKGYEVQIEPIDKWPGTPSAPGYHEPCRFKTNWRDTCELLRRELGQIDTDPYSVVLQLDVRRGQIYLDGSGLKANSKPASSRVILSFSCRHGNLMYPCYTFSRWYDNVRAIALALEALRKVDRYGVSNTGQQYQGWQPLPPPSTNGFESRESAWGFLCQVVGLPPDTPLNGDRDSIIRKAQFATHPDQGGDADRFKRVMSAVEAIQQLTGGS